MHYFFNADSLISRIIMHRILRYKNLFVGIRRILATKKALMLTI